jgi:disulfide oxidoreductase YuzD
MKKNKNKIWLDEPEAHDYPAAQDYLELHFSPEKVKEIVTELKDSKIVKKKAKDILRASGLQLLDKNNEHVQDNRKKVKRGKKLSPILLVRNGEKLIIADGWHRTNFVYRFLSEDHPIPCKLA